MQLISIGLLMKLRYSLRTFLIGTYLTGAIVAFVLEHLSRAAPIQLNGSVIGRTMDDPSATLDELTLYELESFIDRERKNPGSDLSGSIVELKILGVATSSIDPPRFVPLIGNACLHRAVYKCAIKLVHTDGSSSSKVVLLEKNAFMLIKNGP